LNYNYNSLKICLGIMRKYSRSG